MKATYFAAILLSATFSLAAPTGLNDLVSPQNSLPPPKNSKSPSLPLNQIGSILTPPSAPARPDEYVSGVLKSHKPHERGIDLPLHDTSKSSKSKYQSGNTNLLEDVKSKLDGKNDIGLKGVSETANEVMNIKAHGKRRMNKREFVDMAVDHLGRKVVRRGNDFQIQEIQDQGRQWGGANELSDENDEPFYEP
ncbi:hypothetical protein V865_003901 [Kwoniella europaea PYCC6329]|uniref:RxLR effector protein n=1 Tax=Kwoniella europaea PYCC6329 TaxID=1423913 RepID=A0AAX4KIB1_9TREE